MTAEPSPDDLAREVVELRAAVAALAEVARDVDARAVALERRVRAIVAVSPAPALAPPATAPEAIRATAVETETAPGAAAVRSASLAVTAPRQASEHHSHRARGADRSRGRHRSRDPRVIAKERAAERRGAIVSVVMMLPWLLCIALFAIALGLVAVSTFQ